MKFGTVITACKSLSRLSGKVLIQLLGMEVSCLIIKRLKGFKYCSHFVLATTKPDFYHELDYEVYSRSLLSNIELLKEVNEKVYMLNYIIGKELTLSCLLDAKELIIRIVIIFSELTTKNNRL
jgi:hypothetical protein